MSGKRMSSMDYIAMVRSFPSLDHDLLEEARKVVDEFLRFHDAGNDAYQERNRVFPRVRTRNAGENGGLYVHLTWAEETPSNQYSRDIPRGKGRLKYRRDVLRNKAAPWAADKVEETEEVLAHIRKELRMRKELERDMKRFADMLVERQGRGVEGIPSDIELD